MPLLVPISVGELFDKISILELKEQAIADSARRANVMREREALEAVRRREIAATPELEALHAELRAVNRALWEIEDKLRAHERDAAFGGDFVELARRVYRENDRRARIKRQINALTGSDIVEEKSYL